MRIPAGSNTGTALAPTLCVVDAAETSGRITDLDIASTVLYKPRRPQDTLLYKLVQENLETFLARAREACFDDDPIPPHVERTFRKFLECRIPAFGFARARCGTCGLDLLIPFSCKTRFCPSCEARRMVETAAFLTDHVIPRVPTRQWVLSLPKRVRFFLKQDSRLARRVMCVFMRAVESTLRRRSPQAPRDSRFGAVVFDHRAGSAINENFHFHVISTDGVFAQTPGGEVEFFEASGLSEQDIRKAEAKIRRRVLRCLQRHACLDEASVEEMLSWEHQGGFSLDASVRIPDWDRQALERVARYCARPSFAEGRLGRLDSQTLAYALPRPRSDGRTSLLMTPLDLMAHLASLIPPPRRHRIHYMGVLAPNSSMREKVVASAGPSAALFERLCQAQQRMGLSGNPRSESAGPRTDHTETAAPPDPPDPATVAKQQARKDATKTGRRASYLWAMLIARVYEALPLLCLRCGQPMKIIAFITEKPTVDRFLRHTGEPTDPPPLSPARDPPQADFGCHDPESELNPQTTWM